MNQRIKVLIEQATTRIDPIAHDGACWDFDKEKFAELIIRECAEVCYDHSRAAGGVDTDFGYGYKDCGNDIKRNFGVEE